MSRYRNFYNRSCSSDEYCNNLANQYLVLISIFSVIISQEIEDDEDLGVLGSFLVALGEEISLASELRIACKNKFEDDSSSVVEDVFDRSISNKYKKVKKIKRKYIKKDAKNKK